MTWLTQVDDVLVLLCTVPDESTATSIAKSVVGDHLAACVNILPGLRSIYQWKGDVCDESELLLVLKTTRGAAPALEEKILQLHPYETPEIIAVPVQAGSEAYLEWVRTEATPK